MRVRVFISTSVYSIKIKGHDISFFSVQWNKNAYFNLGLTIAYFWVTLLVMFILYFFIYQVASALEKRSKENSKKVSNVIGVSSSAMTNLVITMSKNHRLTQTTVSSSSTPRAKKKKKPQQSSISLVSTRHTSIDDGPGSSFIHHNRLSNGLDVNNRSSSNETSGEHASVAAIAPNIKNLLTITRVGVGSIKKLEDNRTLLSNTSTKTSMSTSTKQKPLHRNGSCSKARKALRTITFIMGAFVLCWTPVSKFKYSH
jgi:muscarinic acetylcholine receptor